MKDLQKDLDSIDLTFPLIVTDGSNRSWLVKNPSDEPQELFGQLSAFGTRWRLYVLGAMDEKNPAQDLLRGDKHRPL